MALDGRRAASTGGHRLSSLRRRRCRRIDRTQDFARGSEPRHRLHGHRRRRLSANHGLRCRRQFQLRPAAHLRGRRQPGPCLGRRSLARDEDGIRFGLYMLCHTSSGSGESPKMSDSSGKIDVRGMPVRPGKKILRPMDHKSNYQVDATFGTETLQRVLGRREEYRRALQRARTRRLRDRPVRHAQVALHRSQDVREQLRERLLPRPAATTWVS